MTPWQTGKLHIGSKMLNRKGNSLTDDKNCDLKNHQQCESHVFQSKLVWNESCRVSDDQRMKTQWAAEVRVVGLAYRKQVGEKDPGSEGGLHTAAGMGEGGNVICRGQKVRREVLTHFLFLLLGWQNSSPCPLEFTSIPPSHSHSFVPCPVLAFSHSSKPTIAAFWDFHLNCDTWN